MYNGPAGNGLHIFVHRQPDPYMSLQNFIAYIYPLQEDLHTPPSTEQFELTFHAT